MDKVAAYVRVSTEKQAEEDSHVRQRESIESWAEQSLDDDVQIDFYEDIAESGQKIDRNEFEDMMRICGEYDMVVVRELSRFGRSLQKVLNDIEKLQENDCDFKSIKDDQIDTSTAQGQLFLNIIGAFNQYWADLARERTEEMIQRRKEEGKPIGRPKKLSDDEISHLETLREQHDYSYETLSAIAKQKFDTEVSRKTISRYLRNGDHE